MDLVEPFHTFTDEVAIMSTPGHTPGHQSVRIISGGVEAIITGDLMHHPIQCAAPSMNSNFDTNPAAAEAARRSFLADHADRDVLVIGTHFAAPTAGRRMSRSEAKRQHTAADLRSQMGDRVWQRDQAEKLIDEIRSSYKNIDEVMAAQSDLVEIVHTLCRVLKLQGHMSLHWRAERGRRKRFRRLRSRRPTDRVAGI